MQRQRALALGWVGDVALPGAGDAAFMAGLASFLASHLAWIAVLGQRHTGGRLRAGPALAAPHIAAFGALNAYLWKRTGKDRIPVIVYSTALLAMSLAALDSRSPKAATGVRSSSCRTPCWRWRSSPPCTCPGTRAW